MAFPIIGSIINSSSSSSDSSSYSSEEAAVAKSSAKPDCLPGTTHKVEVVVGKTESASLIEANSFRRRENETNQRNFPIEQQDCPSKLWACIFRCCRR
jgi:hypothetical protein